MWFYYGLSVSIIFIWGWFIREFAKTSHAPGDHGKSGGAAMLASAIAFGFYTSFGIECPALRTQDRNPRLM
jgi:hypothetical protein